MITLENDELKVLIAEKGAEVYSITDKATNRECIWKGDPTYWERHSPTLFPNIGSLWNQEYRINEEVYKIKKHGFANDRRFKVAEASANSARFVLSDTAWTLKKYPYHFELDIRYSLNGKALIVEWKVVNNSSETMYFQIGGHPGLNYINYHAADAVHGFLSFDNKEPLKTRLVGDKGCMSEEFTPVALDKDGLLPLTNNTFDIDTIVLQEEQVHTATLYDKNRRPYVTMHFNTPVLAMWSPEGGKAPFVCIEPWAGLPDQVGFVGNLSERNYINALPADRQWSLSYDICFS
jgi:galactose mutarotase-like enzyme